MADNSAQIQSLKEMLSANQERLDEAKATLAQMQASGASSSTIAEQKNLVDGRILGVNAIIKQIKSLQNQAIDSTPKPTVTVVKSGSGTPSSTGNSEAVAAGDFAYGALGNGTAGGLGNAALLSTTTILPNTKKTAESKSRLEAADHQYTVEMNKLSQHWAVQDTSSPEYLAQKQTAMQTQYQWELARNNLEEVAGQEKSNSADTPIDASGLANEQISGIPDLSGTSDDLSLDDTNNPNAEIVVTSKKNDDRIRISARDSAYYTGVMTPLVDTGGVYFPFTPTITHQFHAEYSKMSPTHANTDYYNYVNTPAVQIQIQGQFSAQNLAEAKYTLASMHFFRTVTKMHFGSTDPSAGLPPPVLKLNGYGDFMFNNLNVIITDFSMDLPNNVDYLVVELDNGESGTIKAWVPSLTTFNVTCVVQHTPAQQRDDFNIDQFASGSLLSSGGWI